MVNIGYVLVVLVVTYGVNCYLCFNTVTTAAVVTYHALEVFSFCFVLGQWAVSHLKCKYCQMSLVNQGLTLSFHARGPKRSFDKNKWSKTGFLVIIHTILGP